MSNTEDDTTTTSKSRPTSTTQPTPSNSNPKSKRKRLRPPKPHILQQTTLRNAPWSYIHLTHLSPPSHRTATPPLDELTAHLNLTKALTQFLGLHGSAIPFDILKITGEDLWIRVPAEDRSAVVAAVGGWVSGRGEGWRVRGWSAWDAGVGSGFGDGDGGDVFGG